MRQRGLTLVELLTGLAVAGLLMAGLYASVSQALLAWQDHGGRSEAQRQLAFAMERIALHARDSSRLLVPQPERDSTAWSESARDVLAFSLGPYADHDGDGVADADNDRDGRVDEDGKADMGDELKSGIGGIDDNGDGIIDNGANANDDDEDGLNDEDWMDGADNDGDGLVDEDQGADMDQPTGNQLNYDDDGDGRGAEDWMDVVVYRVQGGNLLERLPSPFSGSLYFERAIARNVSRFEVRRLALTTGTRAALVELTIEVTTPQGHKATASTRLRVGDVK